MGSKEVIKALKKDGWRHVSTKGSHAKFKHHEKGILIVPHPKKDLPIGTINAIMKQAGLK